LSKFSKTVDKIKAVKQNH